MSGKQSKKALFLCNMQVLLLGATLPEDGEEKVEIRPI